MWAGHTEVSGPPFGRGLVLFPVEAVSGGFRDKLALELGFENWWDWT